ncbi:MAG: SDR family NAD(P)-dependent oxidoreductase [Eubacteriales bacterium]|nr:SDR family NAD(P)-dependent oxidoreductase [Eubacteriales bacterium]
MKNKKTALITGASRGIGKAIAESLAKDGYQLYLTCRTNIQTLTAFTSQLEQQYMIRCHAFCADAGSPSDMEQVFTQIDALSGRLDVLVNNAGISHIGLITDISLEEWDRLMRTNLSSVFYTSRLAVPLMLRSHAGKIINISSVWGCVGASCEVAYSASKGGVNAFTMALAKELAPSNIQVNAIACGTINTEMNHFLSPEDLEALTEEIPAGRFGDPAEVGELVRTLCQSSGYLTGQIIRLDGGWI